MKAGRMLVAMMAMVSMAAHAEVYLGLQGVGGKPDKGGVDTDAGVVGQAGLYAEDNLAFELEYRFRQADGKNGDFKRYSGGINAVRNFTQNDLWRPHFLLGIGLSDTRLKGAPGTDPYGMIGVGLMYNLSPEWAVRADVSHLEILVSDKRVIDENMFALGLKYTYR